MFSALKAKFQYRSLKRRAVILTMLGMTLGGIAYAASPDHAGPGMRHGTPEQMQKMIQGRLQKALQEVGASEAQQRQIMVIAEQAFKEMRTQREAMHGDRDAMRQLFSQPDIDEGKIEALRASKIKAMDESSRKLTALLTEASRILSPEQRLKLIEKMDKRGRRGEGKMHG
jgi:protein CpxP